MPTRTTLTTTTSSRTRRHHRGQPSLGRTTTNDNPSAMITAITPPSDRMAFRCSLVIDTSQDACSVSCIGPNNSAARDRTSLEGHHVPPHRGRLCSPSSSVSARRSSRCSSSAFFYILAITISLSMQMVYCSLTLSNPQEYEVEYGGGGGRARVVVDQVQSTATITPPGASSPATLIDYHKGVVIYLLGDECLVGRLHTTHAQSWQQQKRQLQRATGNNNQRIPAILHAVGQHSNPTLYVGDMIKATHVRSVVGRRLYSWCSGRPTWRLSTRRPRLPTYSDYIRHYNQNLTMQQNTGDFHRRKRSATGSNKASRRTSHRISTEKGRRQRRRRRQKATGRKRHSKRGLGSSGSRNRTKKRRGRRNQTQTYINRPQNDAPVILDIPPSDLPEEDDPYPSSNFIRSDKDVQKIKHYESFFQDTTPKPIIIKTNNNGETTHLVNVTEKKTRARNRSRTKSKPITIPNTIIKDGKIFYRHDAKAEKSESMGQNKRYTDLDDFVSDGSSYRPHATYNSDPSLYPNTGRADTQRNHRFSSGTHDSSRNIVPSSGWNQIDENSDSKFTNIHRNTPQHGVNNGRLSHFENSLHRNPEHFVQGRTNHENINEIPQQPISNAFDFYSGPSQAETQVVSNGGRSHATAGSLLGRGPTSSVEGSSGAGGHFSAQAQSIGSQGEITQTHVLGDVMGVQGSASNQGYGHKTHAHVSMGNQPESLASHTNDQGMTISSKVQTGRHGGTVIATAHGRGNSNTESHLDFTPHNNGFQGRSNGLSRGHGTASITTSSLGTASKASYDGEVPGGIFTGTAEAGMIRGHTSGSKLSNFNDNNFEFTQNNRIVHEDNTHDHRVSGHNNADNMIGNIMETVHTPDVNSRVSSFPVTGGSFTAKGFIDQGGLSGGSGTAPQESEIENIASLNNEELPEGGSSSHVVSNDGIVGLATYSRGQVGSPPGPGELNGGADSNNNDRDYLNEYLNRYGNDIYDSGMLAREQTPYIDLGPEIEGLEPLVDVTNDAQLHRQSFPQHQLPTHTGSDRVNFQSRDNNFNQSLLYIPDGEAIPHIMSQLNPQNHNNHNLQNQWREQAYPYDEWEHDTSNSNQAQEYTNTYNSENGYMPHAIHNDSLHHQIQEGSNQQAVHTEYPTEEQLRRQWEEQHLGIRHESQNEIPIQHESIFSSDGDLLISTTAVPRTIQITNSTRQIPPQAGQFTESNQPHNVQIHTQGLQEEQISTQANHSEVLGHILPQSRPSLTRSQLSNVGSQTSLPAATSSSLGNQHQRQNMHQTETIRFSNQTNIPRQGVDNFVTQDLGTRETLEPVGPGKPEVNVVFENNVGREVDQSLLYQRPGKPIEPGEKIPGAPGYRVPAGFRGRVILGHNLPTHAESRNVVQGFNTHVKLSPQNPPSNTPVFASVSGPEASQFLPGGESTQGLHVTLSSGGYQPNMHSSSSSFSHSSNNRPQSSMNGMHSRASFQRTVNTMPQNSMRAHTGSLSDTGNSNTWNSGTNQESWIPMDMNKSWNNQNIGKSWNNNGNNEKSWNNGMMNGGKSWSNSWSSRSSWSHSNGAGGNGNKRLNDEDCGYFIMSCYMVYGPYNQSEVCKPKHVTEDCCC